ncbi:Hpt domain-containing protein [Methyloligella solikamskensis]|uniref:Hpt domain-containing protein n=1 Tax=Methyloligella solikamskensis TaxID=1177756 RepID=A0ABW3JBC6_9HYPH
MSAAPDPSEKPEKLSTEPGKTAALDRAHLARYTAGDAELEKELLTLFADQSGVYMERMRGAETEKAWRDAAHSLKGSAKAVGAFDVAHAAEAAETSPAECTFEERKRLLATLEAALADAKEQIRALQRER